MRKHTPDRAQSRVRRFRPMPQSVAVLLLTLATGSVHASPPLWGLGVKGCEAFLATATGWDQGVDSDIAEYSRYQDWLSGFVSALNLATGDDVLRGAGIDGAMRQVRTYCGAHREADFFNATMGFVRSLSSLR
jgi:hypothetical protein